MSVCMLLGDYAVWKAVGIQDSRCIICVGLQNEGAL
jgi:hypothetical protein